VNTPSESLDPASNRSHVVVMGVCGSGKTTLGRRLARHLQIPFRDGDDFHPPENVEKMATGSPLDHADRQDWLVRMRAMLDESETPLVLACSALKRQYRDILGSAPHVRYVMLDIDAEILARRLKSRTDHFMPVSLLDSQLATLEFPTPDELPIVVDTDASVPEIVSQLLATGSTEVAE